MAWVHGNNPVGQQIRNGRILCEAMFAINEREAAVNIAKTNWPTVGVDPAVNALAGQDVKRAILQPIIEAMRTAVETVLTNADLTGDIQFYDPTAYNPGSYYTKATLLTAAFGAADWCVLAGKNINAAQPVTEILKAVELLTHVAYINAIAGNPYNKWSRKVQVGVAATPALAYAACQAAAPTAWASPGGMNVYEWVKAVPPNYSDYTLEEHVDRIDTYIPATAAIATAYLWYLAGAIGGHDTAGKKRMYEITAGIFAAPNWGAEGNLRHTVDEMSAVPGTFNIETLDDASFLGTGANTYYIKTIEDTVTPFIDDNTNQGCNISVYGFRFDLTFTYN